MKKIFILLALFSASISVAHAGNFIYPFDKIAAPSCRFQTWENLSDDCKMILPRIQNADYDKFKDDKMMRRVYSVLWWSTYDYGWDVGMWSHEWVDIATSQGTPVRAIGDGTIYTAGNLSGWGKTVTIKHSLGNGKYLFSNYSHLSKILVSKGDVITSGTNIGEVGNTGNSYGNHLHFQIDVTDQNHPYYFLNCGKGVDPVTLVNQWLCRDYLTSNTIDPILFLEKQELNFTTPQNIQKIQELQKVTKKIEQKSIKSREQILEEEIQEFLSRYTISLATTIPGDNIELGKTYVLRLAVTDYRGRGISGTMPAEGLELAFDHKALRVFPEKIIAIENGWRDFQITGLKSGTYNVELKLGKTSIATVSVNVFKASELLRPAWAQIAVKPSVILADMKTGKLIMKTKFGSNQLDIPYSGTYVIKSLKGKVKFCNVSLKNTQTCGLNELYEELSFTYDDTYRWVLVFNYVALDYMPISIALYRSEEKKVFAQTTTDIRVDNPLGIDKTYTYFDESISGIKKWIFPLNQGYLTQDRDLTGAQAQLLLKNYLVYLYLKADKDMEKKAYIKKILNSFDSKTAWLKWITSISRITFTKALYEILGLPVSTGSESVWLDEKWPQKSYITALRTNYWFSWRDQFGKNYFQPDKNISVWESLYLIETLDKKRELYALNSR